MSGSSQRAEEELEPPPSKKQKGDGLAEEDGKWEEGLGGQEDESSPSYVQERDVGITEFVSDHEGFFAILKRRLLFLCTH